MIRIKEELDKIELPPTYVREGKACYFDPFRRKLIQITPEETVRQKVAMYLANELKVPKDMIDLEVPMMKFLEGAKGRADIVIYKLLEGEVVAPLAIVECKNEDVFLTAKVSEQAIYYSDITLANYYITTNGVDMLMAVYDENKDNYYSIDKLLSYEQMIGNDFVINEEKNEEFIRFSVEDLRDMGKIQEYNDNGIWIYGSDSIEDIKTFAINFFQGLLDAKHKLPLIKRENFEVVEDIGVRFMDYSNAGGGHFVGDYRSFLVKDRFGEPQVISIGMFGQDPNFRGENRHSYTVLTVAIDRFKTSHNILQYSVDRFLKESNDGRYILNHNGQISSIKSVEVIDYIKSANSSLIIAKEGIELGKIKKDKLIYLDDPEVSEFIYKLIEYALLREEVRRKKRERK